MVFYTQYRLAQRLTCNNSIYQGITKSKQEVNKSAKNIMNSAQFFQIERGKKKMYTNMFVANLISRSQLYKPPGSQ